LKKIYVGNLPWSTAEADLKDLFARFGKVHSAAVITDRETGRSRGFGFIEMDDADAENAIAQLNGREFGQRTLRVNEAQDRGDRGGDRRGPRGGGGGGGGRGGRW
jgi:RNA recognition motif-containing protein